jgi:hypothetical protein
MKNNAAEAAAAAVIKPDVDGERTGPRGLGSGDPPRACDRLDGENPGSCDSMGKTFLSELKCGKTGSVLLTSIRISDGDRRLFLAGPTCVREIIVNLRSRMSICRAEVGFENRGITSLNEAANITQHRKD